MSNLFDQSNDSRPAFVRLTPQARNYWLRLRLLAPASHHDPGQQDKSNKSLFRRQAALIHVDAPARLPSQETIDALCKSLPVPLEIANLMQEAPLEHFLAAALLAEFIGEYNSKDGIGLFSGVERYRRLEERFSHAAIQSGNLFDLWGKACHALQVPPPDGETSQSFLRLLAMPTTLAQMVLHVLATAPRPCVMLGRLWAESTKAQSAAYAKSAGIVQADTQTAILHYDVASIKPPSNEVVIDMPVVSANTLRHQLVREPSMWHLYHALDTGFDETAPALTAMWYNGGDIKPGASEPSGVFFIRKAIRDTFPNLALFSGCSDAFVMGEGNLNVFAWLRCRENNDVLRRVGMETDVSVFDMIDEWTLTRHANRVESGQMPFSFETLLKGGELVALLSLSPYADDLQIGALMAALDTYRTVDATVGGQSARGFGLLDMQFHECEYDTGKRQLYDAYLTENKERLRAELLNGQLGSGKRVFS